MAKAETKKTTEASEKVNKSEAAWAKMSLKELKVELERLTMDIKLGKEGNTSLSKKLKRLVAQEMTKLNQTKKN